MVWKVELDGRTYYIPEDKIQCVKVEKLGDIIKLHIFVEGDMIITYTFEFKEEKEDLFEKIDILAGSLGKVIDVVIDVTKFLS